MRRPGPLNRRPEAVTIPEFAADAAVASSSAAMVYGSVPHLRVEVRSRKKCDHGIDGDT